MGASSHDDVLDGALNIIKNNCTKVTVCSAEPTTYTAGLTTLALADVTVAAGDFTVAPGDVSGRKITRAQKTGGTGTADGTGTHEAYLDVTGTRLLEVVEITSVSIANGASVTFNAVDVLELRDPTTI